MKLKKYDKNMLKPDNKHRRSKWGVVEDGLVLHISKCKALRESFIMPSGQPNLSKLGEATERVKQELIKDHSELKDFNPQKAWFVRFVRNHPFLFQCSSDSSEDEAATQTEIEIGDNFRIPKYVMDEFGSVVILPWGGKGLPAVIVDPSKASPQAKADWVQMYNVSTVVMCSLLSFISFHSHVCLTCLNIPS